MPQPVLLKHRTAPCTHLHCPAGPSFCRPQRCPTAATTRGRVEAARGRRRRACTTCGPRPAAPAPFLALRPPLHSPEQLLAQQLLAQPSQDI